MKKKYLAYQYDGQNAIQHRFEAIDNNAASDIVEDMKNKGYFREHEQVDTFVFSETGGDWEWVAATASAVCDPADYLN